VSGRAQDNILVVLTLNTIIITIMTSCFKLLQSTVDKSERTIVNIMRWYNDTTHIILAGTTSTHSKIVKKSKFSTFQSQTRQSKLFSRLNVWRTRL